MSAASATTPVAACEDVSNAPTEPVLDVAELSTFGPLAADPVLRIDSSELIGDAHYVPGGVLIETTTEAGNTVAFTLVDDSGSIRWRRCLPPDSFVDVRVAPPPARPESALAMSYAAVGTLATETLDLATGTTEAVALADHELDFAASAPGWVLLQPTSFDPASGDSSLTLVDLSSMTATGVPKPPTEMTIGAVVSETGVVGVREPVVSSSQALAAAFVNGAWTTDATIIDAEFGVWTDYAADNPMTFRRASGAVAFTTDLMSARDEGFHDLQVGDVALVRGCGSFELESFMCEDAAFAGFDVTTGAELWRFAGDHWVWAAGDGYALVGGPLGRGDTGGGATLLDVRTAVPVEGQTWPPGTFFAGCCGEPSFTVAEGGALLTSDGHRLSLYVPEAVAATTAYASI